MDVWERRLGRVLVRTLGAAASFLVLAQAADLWRIGDREWQPFFPSVGAAVAIAMIAPRERGFTIAAAGAALGSIADSVLRGAGATEALFVASGHACSAGIAFTSGLLVARRTDRGEVRATTLWLAGSVGAAAVGVMVGSLGVAPPNWWDHLVLWTLAEGVGTYLLGPAPLIHRTLLDPSRLGIARFELPLSILLLAAVTVGVFLTATPFAYLVLPALAWLCLRGGPRYGFTAALAVVVLACVMSANGRGPFVEEQSWPFTPLHAFIIAVGVSASAMNVFAESMERRRIQIAAILSAMPDAVVVTDRAERVVTSNSSPELETWAIDDRGPPPELGTKPVDIRTVDVALREDPESGGYIEIRRVRVGDGTTLSVIRDVTELITLTEHRDASAARWRRIVEAAREGIVEVDSELRIIYASERFALIVGRPVEQLIGSDLRSLISGPDLADARQAGVRLRVAEPQVFEVELLPAGGNARWVLASSAPQVDEDGRFRCSTIFATDITAMKEAELERIELADQLADVEAAEQARLARDLHDGPLQDLTAVQLILAHLATKEGPDSELVQKASSAMIDALIALRSGVHALEPVDVMNGSLGEALERHAIRARGASELDVQVDQSGDTPRGPQAQVLYRIGREAITNAARHARAKRIRISIGGSEDEFVLRVSDDGRGFDGDPTTATGHIGLRSIRERAKRAHGLLRIDSATGRGTTIEVRVPVQRHGPIRDGGAPADSGRDNAPADG